MQKSGEPSLGRGANQHDSIYPLLSFKNGMYQGEMAFRDKSGIGVFYWDSGEFYYGRRD